MIDAERGVGEQDAKIAGLAHDRGRALIIALNKTDLLTREAQKKAMDRTREILAFVPWAPLVTVSALRGRGIKALLGRLEDAVAEHRKRISTAELNRFFDEVLEKHPPPTMHHRAVRLYYITQVSVAPPTFVIMAQHAQRRALQLSAVRRQPDPKTVRLQRNSDPGLLPRKETRQVATPACFEVPGVLHAPKGCRAAHTRPSRCGPW